ncbi:hypothetical protein BDW42DRAFT_164687 [Aspergillus taichungensis]|uniref:Uncharacterized protein n=1 Tax=Aspergillus taichungensis TaxID=482145 RepID=A0A2J5I192_9EURO|nr:hypothetical protein BDW42DRAFT_164687 [Aspergillus taichungensis]
MAQLTPPPARARSPLERLPVEIIQTIFLHNLEFNLPRASFELSQKLSDPVLYSWLIRLAFSSANESASQGFFTPEFLPPPLDFYALSKPARRDLQNAILNCRWCTLPLMRKCQRDYVAHAIRHQCQHLDFSPDDQLTLRNLDSYFHRPVDHHCDCGVKGRRGKGDLVLRARAPHTGEECRVAIWFHFGAFQMRRPNRIYTEHDLFRLPSCAVDTPARLPDKLLRPPWTATRLEFLQLLSMDAYIDEDTSHARSRRVLRQTIRDREFEAFRRLLGLYIRSREYKYPVLWPVSTNHFHVALKYADPGGGPDPFVRLLVEQRWGTVPAGDVVLKERLLARVG